MGNHGGSRFALLVFFIAFLNIFLFHWFGSTGFVFAAIGFFLFLVGLFVDSRRWRDQKLGVLGILGLLGVLLGILIFRDSGFVEFVLGGSVVATLVVFLYLTASKIPFVRSLLELLLIPISLGWSYVVSILQAIRALTTFDTLGSGSKTWLSRLKPIVIGVVISLPIVIVLTSLFAWADPIYRVRLDEWVKKLTELEFVRRLKIRTLFSIAVAITLGPLLFLRRSSEFRSLLTRLRLTVHREMTIVMIAVALVLGSFLAVQWPYVFVTVPAETDLSKFGVATYSEYVTRGFSELLLISLVLYALTWGGLYILRESVPHSRWPLLVAQMVVLSEFVIFLISIARRVWLYQLYHGLTLGRIYGSFLLVWIAIMTGMLFARHFFRWRFVIAEVVATIAVVAVIGLFNAEAFIARFRPPTVNHRIDYVYLSRMSSDGVEGWRRAYEYAEEVLTRRGYESKPLLDREDRREIVYAAVITSTLAEQYNTLLYQYGKDVEIDAYDRDIRSFFLARGYPHVNAMQYVRIGVTRRYFPIFHDSNPCLATDQEIFCSNFFRMVEAEKDDGGNRAKIDALFVWNGSRAQAFQFMKQEVPVDALTNLYENYIVLHAKIFNQSPEERDYDVDISFSMPFLR